MTRDEAKARWLRLNQWRQILVAQKFFYGGLLPWQKMQLRCYRDEMDRLDPIANPEMWAALDAYEERTQRMHQLADQIQAATRYFTAVSKGEDYEEADREAVNGMLREIEAKL